MVQISFPASTNAQVVSGGGESGQTVTAINNTQNTYSVDDMVFMDYRTADIKAQSNIRNGYSNRKYIPFILDNIFYIRDGFNYNMIRRDYNVSTDTWIDSFVSNMGANSEEYTYPRNILGENCLCLYNQWEIFFAWKSQKTRMYYLSDKQHKKLPNGIYYIGRNKAIKISYNKMALINYNIDNDEEGTTIKKYTKEDHFFGAYYDDDKIFVLCGAYNTLGDCFLTSDTEDTTIIKNYSFGTGIPVGLTGIGIGNYLILSMGNYDYNLYNSFGTMQIYKFNSENDLLLADDLPDVLSNLTNKTANCYYDSNSRILTVGTQDEVYVFKFNNLTKKFEQIDIGFSVKDLELSVNKLDGFYYGFKISEDLTMCTLYFTYTTYENSYAEIFLINDPKRGWTIVNNTNQLSISGKVSEVNDDGTYEVSTVLPKELTLSISVTPDTDDITVDGAIQ